MPESSPSLSKLRGIPGVDRPLALLLSKVCLLPDCDLRRYSLTRYTTLRYPRTNRMLAGGFDASDPTILRALMLAELLDAPEVDFHAGEPFVNLGNYEIPTLIHTRQGWQVLPERDFPT